MFHSYYRPAHLPVKTKLCRPKVGGAEQINLDYCYQYLCGHTMKTKFDAQTYDCAKLCRRGGASEPLKLAGSLQGTLGLLLPLQTQQFKTYVISVRFAPQFLEGRGRSKPLPYDISISFQFQTPIYLSLFKVFWSAEPFSQKRFCIVSLKPEFKTTKGLQLQSLCDLFNFRRSCA